MIKCFYLFRTYINLLDMCFSEIGKECFPWFDKILEDKPEVILKPSNFERYYDSEDSLEKDTI